MIRCTICDRFIDTKDCKLREIAPELTGCDGYGIISRTLEKEKKEKFEAAIKKQEIQSKKNLDWMANIKPGDKVALKGSPKSIAGCSHLPLYLANGVFTVLGVTKGGRVICDWDGGKPFHIPAYALNILEKEEKI